MKLIINIPAEKDFIDKALWGGIDAFDTDDLVIVLDAIAHGVPLEDLKSEIKRMEYHMIDCEVLVRQEEVLEIIDNIDKAYHKGDKE